MAKRKSEDEVALEQLNRFLDEPPVIPLEAQTLYQRTHDDHDGTFEGKIMLQVTPDGDMWLITDKHRGPALRFRTPMIGGGHSPHVFSALRILAYAIILDNKEHPE